MNEEIKKIIECLNSVESLSNEDKESLIEIAKSVDKELTVTAFKLERTEKVKRTTAILLEETIEELEQKRKSVELQNRELEIEGALERVRAKAMAMNSPDDLTQTADTFFSELVKLNIKPHRCGFGIVNRNTRSTDIHATTATQGNSLKIVTGRLKLTGHPVLEKIFEGFEKQEEYHPVLKGKEILEYYKVMNPQVQFPDFSDDEIQYGYYFYFKEGGVFAWNDREYLENELEIFRRYTSVLSLTYRRYMDLKQAEAQAWEAQIEAALERVRAKSMAMHKSDELAELSLELVKQVHLLGVNTWFCAFNIYDDDPKGSLEWGSNGQGTFPKYRTPREGIFLRYYTAGQKGETFLLNEINENECPAHYKYLCSLPGVGEQLLKMQDAGIPFPTSQIDHVAYFKYGYIIFITFRSVPEAHDVFKRFAKVFEQSYARFLDLKKAEEQAREAQIELSLERIRAQVTAMKESAELLDIVVNMRKEFVTLGHEAHYFWHMRYLPDKYEKAMTSGDGNRIGMVMTLPRHIHGDIKLLADWEKSDESTIVFPMEVERAVNYVDKMITLGDFQQVDPNAPSLDDIRHIGGLTFIMARTTHGEIGYSLPGVVTDIPDEDLATIVRFAGVFDLAYRRFEDLKSAERRNREALIELALERVRARTMAMQKSSELAQTTAHLFTQLKTLGIKPYRCNIAIINEKSDTCQLWSTTNSGNVIPTGSALPLNEYPVLQDMYDGWKTKKSNHIIKLIGKERLEWSQYISKHLPFEEYKPKNIDESALLEEPACFSNLYFKQGFFTIHTREELSEKDLKIIQRFAYVFEQTYTRFLDLENAEKQNKLIQAENERKTQELEEARELQLAMLPTELPKMPNLEIAVYMQTATEVGGDYYDFHVDDEGILTGVIGDATGHGMKAGTIVTITKSMFNSLASENNILDTLSKISKVIKDMKFRQLSMCLMMFRIEDNTVAISSAAMPPALIYRKNKNKVEEFELRGMPLGAMKNFPYKLVETKLHPGDTVLLMSDGFPELLNDKNFMYGYDKTKSEFCSVGEKAPNEIVEHLKNSASHWLNGRDPDDDVTFVVIKIK